MNDLNDDVEDIEVCAREGRRPRDAGPYRVSVGDALSRYRQVIVQEACLSGRALRELAALHPPEDHVFFAVLAGGSLEEIRLEEMIDLREGIEKFVAFESDRLFRFTINGSEYQWGGPFITGATVLKLANVDAGSHSVLLRGPDGSERPVGSNSLIDLAAPGVEQFRIVPIARDA